jgi:hypothetical protein
LAEGCTNRIRAGRGVGRTYGDLLSGAVAVLVVIDTVFHVTYNALVFLLGFGILILRGQKSVHVITPFFF